METFGVRSPGGAAFAAMLALTLLVGCGGGGGDGLPSGAPISGDFVGAASTGDDFVAVLADPSGSGGPAVTAERRVRGYFCGPTRAEWFTGTVAGNTVALTSVRGHARLEASLRATGATGTVTLPDGTQVDFSIAPARQGAGVYDITTEPDGRFSGLSTNGASVEGQSGLGGMTTGSVTLPDGQSFPFQLIRKLRRPAALSVIALPGFQDLRGTRSTIRLGAPWVDPDTEP